MNLSQAQFARKYEISLGVVHAWEQGCKPNSVSILLKDKPALKDKPLIKPLSLWTKQFGEFPRKFNIPNGDNTCAITIREVYEKYGEERFKEVFDWVKLIDAKDYGARVRSFATAASTWNKKNEKSIEEQMKEAGYV